MRCFSFSVLLCLLTVGSTIAEDEFAPAVRIEAGGAAIDVGGFRGASPFVGDFDGDGLKDLLVGQDEPGRLRIYRNVGTNEEPRFDDFKWFRVNGEIAELPSYGPFRPQLADLNGDGEQDVIAASQIGLIFWYRRTAEGAFADPEILKLADGQVLNAGTDAGCHIVDWDGDGDYDLIVTGSPTPDADAAEVCLVENEGLAHSLSLTPPRPLEADGQTIQGSRRETFPVVADWNRDGKKDLLLNTVRHGICALGWGCCG